VENLPFLVGQHLLNILLLLAVVVQLLGAAVALVVIEHQHHLALHLEPHTQ
jgi:hypothetical protein